MTSPNMPNGTGTYTAPPSFVTQAKYVTIGAGFKVPQTVAPEQPAVEPDVPNLPPQRYQSISLDGLGFPGSALHTLLLGGNDSCTIHPSELGPLHLLSRDKSKKVKATTVEAVIAKCDIFIATGASIPLTAEELSIENLQRDRQPSGEKNMPALASLEIFIGLGEAAVGKFFEAARQQPGIAALPFGEVADPEFIGEATMVGTSLGAFYAQSEELPTIIALPGRGNIIPIVFDRENKKLQAATGHDVFARIAAEEVMPLGWFTTEPDGSLTLSGRDVFIEDANTLAPCLSIALSQAPELTTVPEEAINAVRKGLGVAAAHVSARIIGTPDVDEGHYFGAEQAHVIRDSA